MTESKYLIDTSAWIEYFRGTDLGGAVSKTLDNPKNECFYVNEIIMALSSKLSRDGLDPESYCGSVRSKTNHLSVASEEYFLIGIKHAALKAKDSDISYTDAALWYLCETRRLKLITKDAQLKAPFTILLR